MATKTNKTVDDRVEPVEFQSRHRGVVGGVIAAAVVTAGLLFGGGVLLGAQLPNGEHPGADQGQAHAAGPQQAGQRRPPHGAHPDGQPRGPQGAHRGRDDDRPDDSRAPDSEIDNDDESE